MLDSDSPSDSVSTSVCTRVSPARRDVWGLLWYLSPWHRRLVAESEAPLWKGVPAPGQPCGTRELRVSLIPVPGPPVSYLLPPRRGQVSTAGPTAPSPRTPPSLSSPVLPRQEARCDSHQVDDGDRQERLGLEGAGSLAPAPALHPVGENEPALHFTLSEPCSPEDRVGAQLGRGTGASPTPLGSESPRAPVEIQRSGPALAADEKQPLASRPPLAGPACSGSSA